MREMRPNPSFTTIKIILLSMIVMLYVFIITEVVLP